MHRKCLSSCIIHVTPKICFWKSGVEIQENISS